MWKEIKNKREREVKILTFHFGFVFFFFFGYCLTRNKLPCSNPRLHTSSVVDHWKANNTFCPALFALKASGICDEDAISDCPGFQQLSVVEKSISSTVTTNFSSVPAPWFSRFLVYNILRSTALMKNERKRKKKKKRKKWKISSSYFHELNERKVKINKS